MPSSATSRTKLPNFPVSILQNDHLKRLNPMNSHTIKNRLRAAALAAAFSLVPGSLFGQGNTAPVGVIVYSLNSGTTSAIGVPLFAEAVYSGAAATVAADSLTVSDATWDAGQFAQPGSPYFALILTGGQTGRLLLVTGNTTNSVTLAVGTTNLTGDATTPSFVVTPTDRFELFPGDTLASLFGDGSVTNPVPLQAGTSAFTADTVQIFNGVRWVSYFFHSANNFWVNASGTPANQNNLVLYPDTGLLIGRRGPNMSLALSGRAPTTKLVTRIAGGSVSSVPIRFPTDTTLGALNFSNPGTWVASDDPASADRLNLFNGVKWVAYYKSITGSKWLQVGGDATDQSGKIIPAGSSVLIQKLGTAADSSSFFSQALPYIP